MSHRSTCACFNTLIFVVAPLLYHVAECVDDKRHVVGRLALIAFTMAADHAPAEMHPAARFAHPLFAELRIGFTLRDAPAVHALLAFAMETVAVARLLVEVVGVQWESLAATVAHAHAFLAQNTLAAVVAVYAIKVVRV
jgi:hypothetical protein